MSNKVLITNEQNAVKIPSGLRILIRRSCNAVLNYEKFEGSAEISVIFVDNQRIRELNNQYRNKDSATDVLSFPMDELRPPGENEEPPEGLLGDIVLCPEVTTAQAAEHNRTPDQEAEYLLVHGILHLLGHDHAEPEEKAVMFGLHHKLMDAWETERSLRTAKGGRTEQ